MRVAVVGPELARDFRYANALGLTHFDRYAKLGFDARTVLVNAQTPLYATTDADDAPGRRWWELRRAALAPRHLDFLTFFGRDDADVLPAPGRCCGGRSGPTAHGRASHRRSSPSQPCRMPRRRKRAAVRSNERLGERASGLTGGRASGRDNGVHVE